jgi:Yip1 domain
MDIVTRAKNMILSPIAEWPVVTAEPDDLQGLYRSYIAPLAAIPAVAAVIGNGILFGRLSFGFALLGAIVLYVLSLISIYVVSWIAGRLASMFGGEDNVDRALKLIAYGATASWVGGVFRLVPTLSILSLLCSIYSLYVIYTGVTPLLGVPQSRVIGFMVALIVAIIIVIVVIAVLAGGVIGAGLSRGMW